MTNNACIKILNSDLDELNYIYHISDIHIRKRARHDEYITVFDRFCDLVNKHIIENGKDCLIVVTGDVMHDKSEMIPESIDMLRRFLIMMSDITEVVIIIGNHDTNIFNRGSLDCLTPMVSNLQTKHKLHLLTENCVYVYDALNLLIGVTTLWADTVTLIDNTTIDSARYMAKKSNIKLSKNPIKIALYHGMIHGCTLDNGTSFNSDQSTLGSKKSGTNTTHFNMSHFDSYDITMLGDVHKHQFLNKKKTIAYAGSLIQQKRDEDLLEHGVIEWNINKKKGKFIRIKNDYGMIQINVGSSKQDALRLRKKFIKEYENNELPKNLDIKMVYSSLESKDHFKKVYESITKKHNITKITELTDTSSVNGLSIDFQQLTTNSTDNNVEISKSGHLKSKKDSIDDQISEKNSSNDSSNDNSSKSNNKNVPTTVVPTKITPIKITDNEIVIQIMMNHLKNINKNDELENNLTLTAIRKEISDILNEINYNYEQDIKNIRLKSINFDNMFIYIEGNAIDFEKFNNIVGLNASNYQGKSSFIDIILYSIYGECSRGKRYDVLNIHKKKMNSRIVLDVNGREYIIVRTSHVNSVAKRDLKETVSVWEDGINITADDRIKTHQLIANKICSYDDMINNSFVLQKNGRTFVDLTDRSKKDLLCKMARLDIFDNIFVEAKSRHSSSGQIIGKLIKKLEYYDDMVEIKDKKSTRSGTNLNGKMTLIEKEFNKRSNQKNLMIKKSEKSIRSLENKLNKLVESSHELKIRLSVHKSNEKLLKNYDDEKKMLDKLSKNMLPEMNRLVEINKKILSIRGEKTLKELMSEKNDLLEKNNILINTIDNQIEDKLRKIVYIDDADTKGLPAVYKLKEKDKVNKLRELKSQKELLDDLQKKLTSVLATTNKYNLSYVKLRYDEYMKLKTERELIEEKINDMDHKIKSHEDTLTEIKNHKYNPECTQCMENPITKMKLDCELRIKVLNDKMIKLTKELWIKLNSIDILKYDDAKIGGEDIEVLFNEINEKIVEKNDIEDKIIQQTNVCELLEDSIKKIDTIFENINNNEIIEKEIKLLKLKRGEHKTEIKTKYDECEKLLNESKILHEKIGGMLERVNALTINLNEKTKSYNEYLINSIEESDHVKKYNTIENEIKIIKAQINEKKKKLSILNNKKIKLSVDLEKFLEIKADINTAENKKLITGYIKKILDKNGLVDTLLSNNIIPYLQKNINRIMTEVGHYQVNIEYKNQSINVYKDSGLNIIMSSGYESYLLDLVFRLALVQINNHIKTDFLLIDEGFNACDSDNKNNVKELLEHMRSYYAWILIISHDEFIKSFYDMDIRIQSVDKGSRIENTDNKF